MGLLQRLATTGLRADVEWHDTEMTGPPGDPTDDWWYTPMGSWARTLAGFPIGPDTAMRVGAVFACVSLLAETLASLPCILYRRLPNGGKEKAKEHRLYRTLRRQPNVWQDRIKFFSAQQVHLGLRGAAFAKILDDGRRIAMEPMHPEHVRVDQLSTGRLRFDYANPLRNGIRETLNQDEVLYVQDLSTDFLTGMARASLAREAIAVMAAAEAFVGGFFKNDATGRLVFDHPGQLAPDKRNEFETWIKEKWSGFQNAHRPMLTWGGVKVEEVGKRTGDADFIVNPRTFQVTDVARFWRVPSVMIGLEEKTSAWGTGVEQIKLGFVTFTMRAWTDRWADALTSALLDEEDQAKYTIEFDYRDLLRGDTQSLTAALVAQKNAGFINADEGRDALNLNPREDDGGTQYTDTPPGTAPGAVPPASRPREQMPEDEMEPEDEPEARTIPRPLVQDAADRIVAAEVRDVTRRAGRKAETPKGWAVWLAKYYEDHGTYVTRVLSPMTAAYQVAAWVPEQIVTRVRETGMRTLADGMPEGWERERQAAVLAIIEETLIAGTAMRAA
jgi:HK97 family phage portal protein